MDGALLVVQLSEDDPPGRLLNWLAGRGVDADVRVAGADALPADLADHRGLLVLGRAPLGRVVAHDFAAVRALLRLALANPVPLLGIGLGAQELARAAGGRVAPNPDGPQLGAQLIAKRTAAAQDPLFATLPITPDVLQWHSDMIASLPPGAVLLASAPACENQAFRLGRLAWGVQFHLEAPPQVIRAWAAADEPALEEYDLARVLARVDAADADVAEAWEPFVLAFADVLADPAAVPEPRTVPNRVAAPVSDPAAIRAALAVEMTQARQPTRLGMPTRRADGDD